MHVEPFNPTPDECPEIQRLLDTLAAHERASAPAGFEARLATATQPNHRLVHAGSARPASAPLPFPSSPAHRRFSLRLAAAFALTATVIATIVATRVAPGPSVAPIANNTRSAELEHDVDQLLSVYAAFEGSFGTDLDLLGEDLSTLGAKVRSSPGSDWVEDSL